MEDQRIPNKVESDLEMLRRDLQVEKVETHKHLAVDEAELDVMNSSQGV